MTKREIDLTGDVDATALRLIPLVRDCTRVASLHSPCDDEIGGVYHDDEILPEVNGDDIVVTAIRAGRSDAEFAAAIAECFQTAVEDL